MATNKIPTYISMALAVGNILLAVIYLLPYANMYLRIYVLGIAIALTFILLMPTSVINLKEFKVKWLAGLNMISTISLATMSPFNLWIHIAMFLGSLYVLYRIYYDATHEVIYEYDDQDDDDELRWF